MFAKPFPIPRLLPGIRWSCLALAMFLGPIVAPAQSTTCTVSSADDDPANPAAGTLRAAVDNPYCHTIVFNNDYTIHLKAPLVIPHRGGSVIDGVGHDVVLSGDGNVQIMRTKDSPTYLRNLTFTKGHCGEDCIHERYGMSDPNLPPPTVAGDGGAIYVGFGRSLFLERCTFSGNTAIRNGGAIYLEGGSILEASSSSFVGNSAVGWGGAIGNGEYAIERAAYTYALNSRFIQNSAGHGGAINLSTKYLGVGGSSFSGNKAEGNGGSIVLRLSEGAYITNSTLYGNTATGAGGGVYTTDRWPLYITNSTLAGNTSLNGQGGGVYVDTRWQEEIRTTVRNTIVAGNTGGNCAGPGSVFTADSTHNRADDGSCGPSFINSSSILLGPFGSYGVIPPESTSWPARIQTETMPLLPGSAAIDAGDPTVCADNVGYSGSYVGNLDQRYVTRPQGAVCDIGAFEAGYWGLAQQPIKPDGSSVFNANRGVVPVKFSLTYAGQPTCSLPPTATISVQRLSANGSSTTVNESVFLQAADSGSTFRIDQPNCQYVYNLAASSLGLGSYQANITIGGLVSGYATFTMK